MWLTTGTSSSLALDTLWTEAPSFQISLLVKGPCLLLDGCWSSIPVKACVHRYTHLHCIYFYICVCVNVFINMWICIYMCVLVYMQCQIKVFLLIVYKQQFENIFLKYKYPEWCSTAPAKCFYTNLEFYLSACHRKSPNKDRNVLYHNAVSCPSLWAIHHFYNTP